MDTPKPIADLVKEAVYAMNNGTRTPYPEPPVGKLVPSADFSRFFIDVNEDSGMDDWITSLPLDDDWENEDQIIFNIHRRDDILTPEGLVTKVNVTTSVAIKNCPGKLREIAQWSALAEDHKELLEKTKMDEILEAQESEEEKARNMRIRKAIIMRDPLAWHGRCTIKKGRQYSFNKKDKIRKTIE